MQKPIIRTLQLMLCGLVATAQTKNIPLQDLSYFENNSGKNWQIVGQATSDYTQPNQLTTQPGTGVLANIHPRSGKYGLEYELITNEQHGDLDLSFEFMMTPGSNSGIYLQGRYEIQLNDSWGVSTPKYYDLGGIYQRWIESSQTGYEGYAPRVNAAKAPGLWQKMEISFQAPRFDAQGKKISPAKILLIKVNGLTVHENVTLSGVTRGALSETEVAKGPLRIQGDHGSLALRNFQWTSYDQTAGRLDNLAYRVFYGSYPHDENLDKLKPSETGKTDAISWEVSKQSNDYAFDIQGDYFAPTAGEYTFQIQAGGNATLHIDGKEILDNKWTVGGESRTAKVQLTAGKHTLRIFNNKRDGWLKPALGLWSAGPGFRLTPHHALASVLASKAADPILITANQPTIMRSFMDLPTKERLVHAVSVGHPSGLHYTYDLDKGNVVQVWRGEFLDATPMWNDRGDGSSQPLGALTFLGTGLALHPAEGFARDTTGTRFKPKGYQLDDQDQPTFLYQIFGRNVQDAWRVKDGKMLERSIKADGMGTLQVRLAQAEQIEIIRPGLYFIPSGGYFIEVPTGQTLRIENVGSQKALLAYLNSSSFTYKLLF